MLEENKHIEEKYIEENIEDKLPDSGLGNNFFG